MMVRWGATSPAARWGGATRTSQVGEPRLGRGGGSTTGLAASLRAVVLSFALQPPLSPGLRCAALARIAGSGGTRPRLVIATAASAIQRVPPREHMARASLVARVGDPAPFERISAYLQTNGYARAATVREPGEYSIRGGIVDIFAAGAGEPVRLDLFGDTLETVRSFDP